MYQHSSAAAEQKAGEPDILDRAMEIVSESGLDALTLRNVSARSGLSPSLISYRFGSKQGVVEALADYVRCQLRELWTEREAGLPPGELNPARLGALAIGVLVDNATSQRDVMRTAWAFQVNALRRGQRIDHGSEVAPAVAYWATVLQQSGLNGNWAKGVWATLESVGHILLVSTPRPDVVAWCSDVIDLQFQRLQGTALETLPDSIWRARNDMGPLETEATREVSPTRAKIIDAAKAIIQAKGYRALSHRAVARESGVSLSSTTHHFTSLDDIMLCAYWSIYGDITSAARAVRASEAPATMIDYIDRVLPALSKLGNTKNLNHFVFEEILLLSAQKPALRPVGLSLLASMGQTTHAMVQASSGIGGFEPLDGHVFRHALRGAGLQMMLQPGGDISDPLRGYLKTLFRQ